MRDKYKITFDESNVQEPAVYVLVSKFNMKPVILKAEINEDGSGFMIMELLGDESKIEESIEGMKALGFHIDKMARHILRDKERCFSCGACVSVCPTQSFFVDPETYETHVNFDTCIACGSCIDACSVKALKLQL